MDLQDITNGTVNITDSFKHPKALVRLMNIIVSLSNEFDKDINRFFFEMISNAVHFEGFAVGDGVA